MARTVNEQEYASKRTEILDTTRQLMYTKGYDQITIKDIIEDLKISKGAFYHYFNSKQDLLEALLDRMREESETLIGTLISDPTSSTISRLQHVFDSIGRWKVAQKAYVLSLLRSWYADENALVRQRIQESMLKHIAPLLNELIGEAVHEGTLQTAYPDMAGQMILALMVRLGDTFTQTLFAPNRSPEIYETTRRMVEAYNDAIERVLGAAPGSLHLIDAETINEWFVAGGAG